MSTDNLFTLRFFDDEKSINPQSFTGKELGELIISFHEGLKELIDVRYPEINSDSIRLSVIGIENKSESIIWQYSGEPEVKLALKDLGVAISKNTYTDLPLSTYRSVKNIYSITKKKKCNAELIEKNDRLFIVSPSDKLIKQENVLIKSEMSIYGVLNKIGGDKTKAWVELYDGSKISFSISDNQLHQLRGRVKEPVALKGRATWSAISKKVIYFKISEVIAYAPETIYEGFKNLSGLFSGLDSLKNNAEVIHFLKGDA